LGKILGVVPNGSGIHVLENINNRALLLANIFVVAVPSLGINWLAERVKDSQTAEIVVLNVVCTYSAKETNDSRSRVELGDLVLLDSLSAAGWNNVDSKTVMVASFADHL
jgi:hypothetical protein